MPDYVDNAAHAATCMRCKFSVLADIEAALQLPQGQGRYERRLEGLLSSIRTRFADDDATEIIRTHAQRLVEIIDDRPTHFTAFTEFFDTECIHLSLVQKKDIATMFIQLLMEANAEETVFAGIVGMNYLLRLDPPNPTATEQSFDQLLDFILDHFRNVPDQDEANAVHAFWNETHGLGLVELRSYVFACLQANGFVPEGNWALNNARFELNGIAPNENNLKYLMSVLTRNASNGSFLVNLNEDRYDELVHNGLDALFIVFRDVECPAMVMLTGGTIDDFLEGLGVDSPPRDPFFSVNFDDNGFYCVDNSGERIDNTYIADDHLIRFAGLNLED